MTSASRRAVPRVQAVQPGREGQVLHRAELLEERRVHAHPVDEALDGELLAGEVQAEDLDPTLVQGQQAADEPDERALAGAVGAEDAPDLSALEPHRHVGDRDDRRLLALHLEPLGGVFHEECRDGCRLDGRSVGPGRLHDGNAENLVRPVQLSWQGGGHGGCSWMGRGSVGPDMRKAAGPFVLVGTRARGSGGGRGCVRDGHRKSRGPDLAHGSWCFVRAAYAAEMSARDGHRPPVDGSPEGRLRARGEEDRVHHSEPSFLGCGWRPDRRRAGVYVRPAARCQRGRMTMSGIVIRPCLSSSEAPISPERCSRSASPAGPWGRAACPRRRSSRRASRRPGRGPGPR